MIILGMKHRFLVKMAAKLNCITGAINFDKCPLERFIPIYLIVVGVFGVVKYLINIFEKFLKTSKNHEATLNENFCTISSIYTVIELIMMLFAFMWLIAGNCNTLQIVVASCRLIAYSCRYCRCIFSTGSIWVFRIRPDFNEKNALNYCNKATYLTAFINLVLSYCYLAFTLFIICRYACTICCNCRLKIVRKNSEFVQNELNDYAHVKPSVTTLEMITMDEQNI